MLLFLSQTISDVMERQFLSDSTDKAIYNLNDERGSKTAILKFVIPEYFLTLVLVFNVL